MPLQLFQTAAMLFADAFDAIVTGCFLRHISAAKSVYCAVDCRLRRAILIRAGTPIISRAIGLCRHNATMRFTLLRHIFYVIVATPCHYAEPLR